MFNQPEWLGAIETLTFAGILIGAAWTRLLNWRKYNERTTALETAFDQYQKDIKQYLSLCEICRGEVRAHHEDDTKHVTLDMRAQVDRMAKSIDEIKSFLMSSK
jgi:hypothetical protein